MHSFFLSSSIPGHDRETPSAYKKEESHLPFVIITKTMGKHCGMVIFVYAIAQCKVFSYWFVTDPNKVN